MKYRKRINYTQPQIAQMWDRWQEGVSLNEIGRMFDRGHSSVQRILSETGGIRPLKRRRSRQALSLAERELCRNGGRRRHRANKADQAAWERAKRPKTCKLAQNRALARIVARKLQLEWAPEQIAGWLKRTYRGNEAFQVSHETIYKSLFIQARGALKKELLNFRKGLDLSNIHQNRLNAVARRLNERPRKTLGYYSPAEKIAECVAATD